VRSTANGEEREQAIEELMRIVARRAGGILRAHKNLLRDPETFNEVVQDVCTQFYVELPKLTPDRGPAAWIGRTTINAAINHYRHDRHVCAHLSEFQYTTKTDERCAPASFESHEQLREAFDSLPVLERVVAMRRIHYGETLSTIAAALGLKVAKVSSLLHSAERRLRQILEKKQ
jgi:RNA polymerase sigma factor (sigma-70 family)